MRLIFQLGIVEPKGLSINLVSFELGRIYILFEISLPNNASSTIEVQESQIPDGFSVKHSFVIESFVVCLQINCLVT